MNKKSGKSQKFIDNPRFQTVLVIVLPCLTLIAALLIMIPQLNIFFSQATSGTVGARVTPFAVPSVTPKTISKAVKPTPGPTPTPPPMQAKLTGSSTERDLLIMVRDQEGNAIQDEVFKVTLYYPDGEVCTFDTETNGSCYVVDLDAGEYSVSMVEQSGYLTAEKINCTVKAQVEYVQIDDVDEYLDIVDSSSVSYDEVKTTTNDAPEVAVAEVIPADAGYSEVDVSTPQVDANGNQMYTYSFQTNEEGFLFFSSGELSSVKLFDEDGDGVPECGMQTDEFGNTSTVNLYNADNTPDAQYAINAVPIVTSQSVSAISGWQESDGNVYYYYNGSPVTGLKEIDGHIYFFNEYGVRARSVGIDVSFYNEYINWPAVKANGIDFAIIRLGGRYWSREDVYNDERTIEYLNGAKAAGIKVGAYFYSTATNAKEAVQEASFALEKVAGYSLDYPIFIDMEYSGIYPEGRADNLTRSERAEIANAFCQTIINSGYAAGVYTGQNFLLNAMDANSINQYPLWLANYTSRLQRPSYSGSYSMWQFTDMGQVRGISGYVDMNVIF